MRDWKALVLLLLAPFLFICFFTYALTSYLDENSFVEPFSVALVDKEDTAQTRVLANQIAQIRVFREVLRMTEEEAVEKIRRNEIAAAIIIPEKFTDSLAVGENKPLTVIGNRSMPLESQIVRNLARSAANLISASQSAINAIYRYNRAAGIKGAELEEEFNQSTMKILMEAMARHEIFSEQPPAPEFNLTPAEYFTAALLVVFLLFAGMPAMKLLVAERCYGLARRLDAADVRLWQRILSKFLVSLLLSTVQFLMVAILTAAILKNYWGAPVKNILLLFGAIIFAVSAWSVLVSSIAGTPASADAVGNLGILLMSIVGGSIYPLSSMPGFIRRLSAFTINRWAMDGFMNLFSGNRDLGITSQALTLLAIGAAMLVLAVGFMYRRKQE